MSPKKAREWTVSALEQWARDLFAPKSDTPTRAEYEHRHEALERQMTDRAQGVIDTMNRRIDALHALHDKDVESIETLRKAEVETLRKVVLELQEWRANVTGRTVGFGVIGAVLVGSVVALITHLIGGG